MYKKWLLTLIVISVFFLCEDIFDRRQFLIFLFVFSFCYTTLQVKYWQLFNRMTHYMLTYCNCCLHSCCIFRQIYKDICTYVQVLSMYLKTHLWFNVIRISHKLTRNPCKATRSNIHINNIYLFNNCDMYFLHLLYRWQIILKYDRHGKCPLNNSQENVIICWIIFLQRKLHYCNMGS